MHFEDVLAPIVMADFVSNYLGTRFLRVKGSPGRFSDLVPWTALNDALAALRSVDGRIKLFRNGRALAPEQYLVAPDAKRGTQVNAARVERAIRDGATLIVDAVDELLTGVRGLAEDIERYFPIKVGVNLYAGWGSERGFDLHWDDHDTLIVQVYGRKAWKVYTPTIPHPLEKVRREHARPADDQLAWSGNLCDGDVLYMPRGWWHVASPIGEVSLHLTIGLGHPTGVHFTKWISRELSRSTHARADIPFARDDRVLEEWVASLRSQVMEHLSLASVRRFQRWMETHVPVRPSLDLPRAVSVRALTPLLDGDAVVLCAERRLMVSDSSGNADLTFQAAGVRFRTRREFRPVLERLSSVQPVVIAEVTGQLPAELRSACRLFLMALEAAGALRRTSRGAPHESHEPVDVPLSRASAPWLTSSL